MGYSVYWCNDRWQGYGVLAYCDYPDCKVEIDRGLGYKLQECEDEPPTYFACQKHEYSNYDKFKIDLEKERPEWLEHVLNDDSWKEWRDENPVILEKYEKQAGREPTTGER